MKHVLITFILALAPVTLLAADFNAGMTAYERQDYAAAAREFRVLARNGDPHAQYMMGRLYALGNGVRQDFIQAHKWYNLAASRDHNHATQARDALARRMSSTQIATAQREARQWQPKSEVSSTGTPTPLQTTNAIQRSLNELGYDAGLADGLAGVRTRTAIRDYQSDHGLYVDGQPTEALRGHLSETLRTARSGKDVPKPQAGNWQWRRLLLHDAFHDGNYTRDPTWTVAAGRFSAESGTGLRTVHEARRPLAEARQQDLPTVILEAILGEINRSRDKGVPADSPDLAEIYAVQNIDNAFAIQLDLTVRQASGPLLFGPYQGSDRNSGYHLVYTPDVERGLHLVKLTGSGSSIIKSVDQQFSLNRQYAIQWTRDTSGSMIVSLDGNEVFRVNDRNFTDPFDGLTLINKGGDFTVREVTIHGIN